MIHIEETTFQAKTVEECLSQAENEFSISKDKLKYTIIQEPREGFLGIGKKEAIIKVLTYDYPEKEDVKADESVAEEKNVVSKATQKVEQETEAKETADETVAENEPVEEKKPAVITEIPPVVYEVKDYVINIIKHLGVDDIDVDIEPMENGVTFVLKCESENKGNIIGKRGETLDALQYLASVVVNRDMEDYFRINIDSNGYREKRKATLEKLAAKIARNVLKTGRNNSLEPMNPYERRIIHSVIADIDGVSSHSVGVEPYRKVVITSDNPRKNYNRKGKGNGKYNNRNRKGGKYRRDDNYVPKPKSMDSMKTSFEKEYSKPKPEDSIEGGLYGKIEL